MSRCATSSVVEGPADVFPKKDSHVPLTAYFLDWCALLFYKMFVVKCPRRPKEYSDWYENIFVVLVLKV